MKTTNRLSIISVLLTALLLAGCNPILRVGELQTESQSVELGDAASVRVEINMGAGDLEVTGGAEKLLEADFTYNVAELKPEVKFTDGSLVIWEPGKEGRIGWRGTKDFRNEWSLRFNNETPMDLSVEMGAGSGELQLADLSLTGLDVTLGAGESTIDLSGNWTSDMQVTIDTGAANVTVRLPKDVGVHINLDSGASMVNAPDLKHDGDAYTNDAYGVSNVTLQIVMETGIGQVNFEEVDAHAQEKSELQNLLDEQVKLQEIPGMIMAVRLADGTVIWDTAGYISPSGDERWTPNTPSMIASVTKTFTAVVVMQLVEEGKLSLNDPVDAWFPDQPDGDKITVRMLLSHTSGLANYQTVFGGDPEMWTREWKPEELIALVNQAGPIGTSGSNTAHYSNTNYIMLGLIIEKITGNSWASEVESRIIKPLELNDTRIVEEGLWNGVVPGYLTTSNGYINILEHPLYPHVSASTAWAAGGIVSSTSDLMTFASALFDGKLVSKETLVVMTQPMGTGDGRTWGLGGGVDEIDGHNTFGMGGDTASYHAFFIGTIDGKFIVTALVNADNGDVISPSRKILQQYISGQK